MPASALVRRVFIGLLVANLAVVGVKLAVGLSSGSLAVLGGAVDSCVDALNNVLALIVVRVSTLLSASTHESTAPPSTAREPDESPTASLTPTTARLATRRPIKTRRTRADAGMDRTARL